MEDVVASDEEIARWGETERLLERYEADAGRSASLKARLNEDMRPGELLVLPDEAHAWVTLEFGAWEDEERSIRKALFECEDRERRKPFRISERTFET